MHKIIGIFLLLFVVGCSDIKSESSYPEQITQNRYGDASQKKEGIFGISGITIGDTSTNTGLKINSYLWRASLDTVSFMPLASVDPFGGVIITDWYSSDATKNERFKLNILVMTASLRADGIQVTAFKETKDKQGKWQTAEADAGIATKIENAILTRARELKVSE